LQRAWPLRTQSHGDAMNLAEIPALADRGTFHVVVESPRGSNVKLKYEPKWEAMSVSRPLPAGVVFPFDWGFVPSTHTMDGDPLDAMLLWDVVSCPGLVLECRAIAVLQAEQNRTNHDRSSRIRNDRIMAIPIAARREAKIESLDDLPLRQRQELEQFAIAATALEGKDVRVIGWENTAAAITLIRDSLRKR
jgi:inorganic pyrophosphatase